MGTSFGKGCTFRCMMSHGLQQMLQPRMQQSISMPPRSGHSVLLGLKRHIPKSQPSKGGLGLARRLEVDVLAGVERALGQGRPHTSGRLRKS